MLEAVTSFTMAEHMGGAAIDPPIGPPGYNRLLTPNRRPFATTDGFVVALPYTTRHWQVLLAWIEGEGADGDGDWAAASWILDPDERAGRVDELYGLLGALLATRSSSDWLAILRELDIPAGQVNDLQGVLEDPHLASVDFFQSTQRPPTARPCRPDTRFATTARRRPIPARPYSRVRTRRLC